MERQKKSENWQENIRNFLVGESRSSLGQGWTAASGDTTFSKDARAKEKSGLFPEEGEILWGGSENCEVVSCHGSE